jgi:ferredoxin
MTPVVEKKLCIGCGNCVEVCPPQALTLDDAKVQIQEDICEECGFCAVECPVEAIRIDFPSSAK